MSELQEAQFKRVIDRLLDDNKALRDLVDFQATEKERLRGLLSSVMNYFDGIGDLETANKIRTALALGEGEE